MTKPPRVAPEGRRCRAHSKATGQQCKLPAILGGTVCAKHGGSAPQVKRRAAERVVERTITEQWAALARPAAEAPKVDPKGALLAEIAWTSALVEYLRRRLGALDPDELVWGRVRLEDKSATQFPGVNTIEAAEVNALVRLLGVERDRLTRQVEVAIKLDLDQRMIESHERIGRILINVLDASLMAAGLDSRQFAAARAELHRQLLTVAGSL